MIHLHPRRLPLPLSFAAWLLLPSVATQRRQGPISVRLASAPLPRYDISNNARPLGIDFAIVLASSHSPTCGSGTSTLHTCTPSEIFAALAPSLNVISPLHRFVPAASTHPTGVVAGHDMLGQQRLTAVVRVRVLVRPCSSLRKHRSLFVQADASGTCPPKQPAASISQNALACIRRHGPPSTTNLPCALWLAPLHPPLFPLPNCRVVAKLGSQEPSPRPGSRHY